MEFTVPKQIKEKLTAHMITRFPPEPSGYLHIGHARAIYINHYLAKASQGSFILRFDDTNPKVESESYVQAILEDLNTLNITPDRITRTSDYFDTLWDLTQKLLQNQLAYVDLSTQKEIEQQRSQLQESPYRNNYNLTQGAIRIKLDPRSKNGALRDPTIYRYIEDSWFPTYDFACPVVDYLERITHVFRDTNYSDRDSQYLRILDLLIPYLPEGKTPVLMAFGRLNFKDTVVSKRKIKELIAENTVTGWDDLRLATLRGLFRKGLTVQGLESFIVGEGLSKNIVETTFDKMWGINRKIIDKIATRYQAVPENSPSKILFSADQMINRFDRYPELGQRVLYGPKGTIYTEPFNSNVGLINLGVFDSELKPLDTSFKDVPKVCWVGEYVPIVIHKVEGKEILSKVFWGEEAMKHLKPGEYIQLLRMGYYKVDPMGLIEIP